MESPLLGPFPGGRGLRTGHEGPISMQQECIEVPPGARHGARLRERLERGSADRQWSQGCSVPASQSAEALASGCTGCTVAIFAPIVPSLGTTRSEPGELWTQRLDEEQTGTLVLLSAQDGPSCSIPRGLTALLRAAEWMSQKQQEAQRVPTPPLNAFFPTLL